MKTVYDNEHVKADCGVEQKTSVMFVYAFDGFPIYGSVDQNGAIPTDLDSCNGHVGATMDNPEGAYHYHASTTFPNLPNCLSGVVEKITSQRQQRRVLDLLIMVKKGTVARLAHFNPALQQG